MQLALIILAGFGALLFVISFLSYVISGFRHHFVTGLISALPVLNIVTLPSLWDRDSKKFFTGLFGFFIAAVAWVFGANTGVKNLIAKQNNNSNETVIVSTTPQQTKTENTILPTSVHKKQNTNFSYNKKNMFSLPDQPIYKMGFEVVPVTNISSLKGRIVKIIKTNNEELEGRIINVSPGSVMIESDFNNELPIASIKQLKLMVKKAK